MTWDKAYTFRCLRSDIAIEDGEKVLPVPKLGPGESGKINVFFRIPTNVEKMAVLGTTWQFFYNDKPFGKVFQFAITVRPDRSLSENVCSSQGTQTERNDSINISTESFDIDDDQIPFPACFNMDVRFTNNNGDASEQPSRPTGGRSRFAGGARRLKSSSSQMQTGVSSLFFDILSRSSKSLFQPFPGFPNTGSSDSSSSRP